MGEDKNQSRLENNLKRLVRASMIVFIGLLLSKIFFYGYRIIVARFLGPEVYGAISLSIMIIGWFVAISSLGLSEGVLRYAAFYKAKKDIERIRHAFKFSLSLAFITSIISCIVLFLASNVIAESFFHSSDLAVFLRFFSILIPVTLLSYIFLSTIKAYEMIAAYSFILNILQNFIKFFLLALLLYLGLQTDAVVFSYMLGTIAMLIAAYLVCKNRLSVLFIPSKLETNEKKSLTREMLSYSWPLMLFAIVTGILPSIDSIVLGYFKDMTVVGVYNAAIPLAMLLNFSAEISLQLFFPLMTRDYSRGNIKLIRETSRQLGKWVFTINLPVLIVMILFPGTIINFFFGADYLAAENSLRILAIGFFFSSIFMISDSLISVMGKSKLNLLNIFVASIVNLILNIIFVPRLGMNGAALATMLSFILWSLMRGIESYYLMNILPFRRKMLRILLVSIIPAIFLFYARGFVSKSIGSLILLGIIFLFIYAFLLFVTNCLDKNDFTVINSFKKKIFG